MGSKCSLMQLPRCGAYARSSGKPCQQPAMANGRCHFHGGKAKVKHGHHTKKAIKERKNSQQNIRALREVQNEIGRAANGV